MAKKKAAKKKPRTGLEVGSYVIARTYSAGVFAGTLVSRDGREVVLSGARRLWRWVGAASLSELAVKGPGSLSESRFPAEVPTVLLTECIELLPVSAEAQARIAEVPIWTAR